MDDTDESTHEYPYARPLLIIEMPRMISDDAALQLLELMQRLASGFNLKYKAQIQRAQVARQRAIDEFLREQDALRKERQFRAAQLDIPLCDDSEEDERQIPF
jgi:hypothetical protein